MIFCRGSFGVGLAKQQCCGSQPQGHLATFADSFNCHSWGGGRRLPARAQGAEVKGAGEDPMVYRTDPHNKALAIWPQISTVLGLTDPVLVYFNGTFAYRSKAIIPVRYLFKLKMLYLTHIQDTSF